jgi:hypothetical protein
MACGQILEFSSGSWGLSARIGSRRVKIAAVRSRCRCWRWCRRSWCWGRFAHRSACRLVLVFARARDTLVFARWCESAAESLRRRSWRNACLLTRTSVWSRKFACVLKSAPTLACSTVEAHTTPLIFLAFFNNTSVAD